MAGARVWKFGNDVDTDQIIPGRFIADWNKNPEKLGQYAFADVRPEFAGGVKAGDIIVAERNFGCGSSRESAPVAIKVAGVKLIIAESFARIFYRNCINIGLLVLESPDAARAVREGDDLELDEATGTIRNLTQGTEYACKPVPPFLQEIISAGGLKPYVQKRLGIAQ